MVWEIQVIHLLHLLGWYADNIYAIFKGLTDKGNTPGTSPGWYDDNNAQVDSSSSANLYQSLSTHLEFFSFPWDPGWNVCLLCYLWTFKEELNTFNQT